MTMEWLPRSRRIETLEAEVARLRAQLMDAERGIATDAVAAFGERLGTIYAAVAESLAATAANSRALADVAERIDVLERWHEEADENEDTLKKDQAEWRGALRSVERQLRLNEKDQADSTRVILGQLAELRAANAAPPVGSDS